MTAEARLEQSDEGLVPEGEGWFVVNAREARWATGDFGTYCSFEGEPRFEQLGIHVAVLQPGQPMCLYHAEGAQEDFLVVAGEALLLVEGEERPLATWDFFHSPVGTEHVILGAGERPCVVVAVGARTPRDVRYPFDATAARHGASAKEDTDSPGEAYAPFAPDTRTRYRDALLPEL